MQRNFAVLSVFCFVLLSALFVPSVGKAQTFKQATSTGRYDVGYGNMVLNVNVLEGIYPAVAPYPYISLQGTVGAVTNSWHVSGNVQSVTFSWRYSFGSTVQHAVLVSKTTTLYYLVSPFRTKPVHVVATLTQTGAHGQGGFQVISDDTLAGDAGKILFQSQGNSRYTEVPFMIGGVTILE